MLDSLPVIYSESDANALHPIHQAHAMQYVVKVRNRYLDKPEVYRYYAFFASSADYSVTGYPFRACRIFLGILANFNSAQPDYKKVLSDIAALFLDQADLLVEFACFSPVPEQDKVPALYNDVSQSC
jgi:histone deacetylase complex regulatory component SIN3